MKSNTRLRNRLVLNKYYGLQKTSLVFKLGLELLERKKKCSDKRSDQCDSQSGVRGRSLYVCQDSSTEKTRCPSESRRRNNVCLRENDSETCFGLVEKDVGKNQKN